MKAAPVHRERAGISRVELLVCLAVLLSLAAVALPRIAGLETAARIAKMGKALAAIQAAATLNHAHYRAKGLSPALPVVDGAAAGLFAEGVPVRFVYGYPAAAQMAGLAGISQPDYRLSVLPGQPSGLAVFPDDSHDGKDGHPDCGIRYLEPMASHQGPRYEDGQLTAAHCQ